jgi:RND family efflux transporter MFP subunit
MERNRKMTIVVGLALVCAAIIMSAWPDTPADHASKSDVLHVRTAMVAMERVERPVRFSGITRSQHRASLSFSVPGRLTARPVRVGDRVRVGQVIGTLDQREFRNSLMASQAQLAELDARLSQARKDLDRVKRLQAARAATAEEYEHARLAESATEASRAALLAQLQEARRVLEESSLKAPFAGTVAAVHLEPGEWAYPGLPVVEVSGDGPMELEVQLPEPFIGTVQEGQMVSVELPFSGDGRRIGGRVRSIARAAIGPGRLFPAVIALDQANGLVAGLTAELVLDPDRAPALMVPVSAVLNPGSTHPFLFRVRDGRAEHIDVTLGELAGDRVAVQGAISSGDRVIVAGNTKAADGDPVEVQ